MLATSMPPVDELSAKLQGLDLSATLIERILREDRPMTPDADLAALIDAFGEAQPSQSGIVTVLVARSHTGSAGFAFDRDSMKITSLPKDRRYPSMHLGDVIVAVNDAPVASLADYNRLAKGVQQFRLGLRPSPPASSSSGPPSGHHLRSPATPPVPAAQPTRAPKAKAGPKKKARAINNNDWAAMAMDIDGMSYEDLLALEARNGPVKNPGLQDDAIDAFPVEHVCGGGDECSICLEDFCDGEEMMRLCCMHTFHSCCARDWLRRMAKCPCCNFELK